MLPLATTTITISRTVNTGDGYAATVPAPTVVEAGVNATISPPKVSVRLSGGDRIVYTAQMRSDPADIQPGDTITDGSGTVWTALWATAYNALGLDFTIAEIRLVTGAT